MIFIDEQVRTRRAALGRDRFPPGSEGIWGLGLSGGGIRSATFCFGLLRALAQNDVLLRVDLLSTVSGGGYIGAMLGRLFSRAGADAQHISDAMKDASSRWFAWWLRANGRYLTPRGAKDWTYAVALYIRSLIGIHFEFGLVAAFLGITLGFIDLGGWQMIDRWSYEYPHLMFPLLRYLPEWMPVIAFLEPPVIFMGAAIAIAYWSVPWVSRTDKRSAVTLALWCAGVGVALLFAGSAGGIHWAATAIGHVPLRTWFTTLTDVRTTVGATWRFALEVSGFALVLGWLTAVPIAYVTRTLTRDSGPEVLQADEMRTRLTKGLAMCFRIAAVIFGLALVDRAAWFIAFELDSVAHVGVGLGVTAAVLRAVFPKLSGLTPGRTSTGLLLQLGRILGYLLTFALCSWWVSVIYAAGLGALFQHGGPQFGDAVKVLWTLAVSIGVYFLLTGSNLAFLNLSSLHGFYRARLVRSYLGAANAIRLGRRKPLGVIDTLPSPMPLEAPNLVAVGDTEIDDDIKFCDYSRETGFCGYAPYMNGGPVHLISMCINQTRDPRGGLFNQDRRGLALCVASGGIKKIAQDRWEALPRDDMTLGSWTAISGAAVAPGLGGLTRGGMSALAFFAGVRLGYWWEPVAPAVKWLRVYAKSFGMLAETFGVFRGATKSNWFLTDGGHFENTGAYALLAERAKLIIVADCGADPNYAFCDLENLVRKARIDLQAEIIFQKPLTRDHAEPKQSIVEALLGKPRRKAVRRRLDEKMALFGSLDDLASDTSTACLAFATVTYAGQHTGKGFLILIKPNISSGLPVDLINFKAQNPAFPQETTADQWFSEAQWESYSQLGYYLGAKLDEEFLEAIISKPDTYFEDDERAAFDESRRSRREPDATTTASAVRRLPARIGSATVRAGLGVGAIATLAVSVWQGIESTRTSHVKRTSDERSALKELTDLWAKVPPQASGVAQERAAREMAVGELAATILRSAEALCPVGEPGLFQKFSVAGAVFNSALEECTAIDAHNRPKSCATLLDAADPVLQGPYPQCLVRHQGVAAASPAPRYWIYDYSTFAPAALAHPCDSVAARRRETQRRHLTGSAVPAGRADAGDGAQSKNCGQASAVSTTAAAPNSCEGKTIYTLIYDPRQLKSANMHGTEWGKMGALVTPSENVVESARLAGRPEPLEVSTTTVRYSDGQSEACAQLLRTRGNWQIEPVSPQFPSPPGVVEVWLAPSG